MGDFITSLNSSMVYSGKCYSKFSLFFLVDMCRVRDRRKLKTTLGAKYSAVWSKGNTNSADNSDSLLLGKV